MRIAVSLSNPAIPVARCGQDGPGIGLDLCQPPRGLRILPGTMLVAKRIAHATVVVTGECEWNMGAADFPA